MPLGAFLGAPRVRLDGGKVVIDVDWDDADSLHDYLRRHSVRSTAYLDRANREARLMLLLAAARRMGVCTDPALGRTVTIPSRPRQTHPVGL